MTHLPLDDEGFLDSVVGVREELEDSITGSKIRELPVRRYFGKGTDDTVAQARSYCISDNKEILSAWWFQAKWPSISTSIGNPQTWKKRKRKRNVAMWKTKDF
ncbi:hypothetical protein GOBAR_AA29183 [Gossypium barbadense]|uniref:Uncharacterized protein n=1 Tax=Gossypium barbadense TaxID=3634 RepID=A0A2P5WK81_GOSBA|nr:hypothetical protein GOBAR_AA29183 [Gossypium barbadense]